MCKTVVYIYIYIYAVHKGFMLYRARNLYYCLFIYFDEAVTDARVRIRFL